MTHFSQDLDDTVHQRIRLGILALLAEGHRVQFGFLQEALGLTDGNLSRHLSTLQDAGYAAMEKGYEGRRPRTWIRITMAGNAAFSREVELLRTLVSRFDEHASAALATVRSTESGLADASHDEKPSPSQPKRGSTSADE